MSSRFLAVLIASLLGKALLAIVFADIEPQYDERQFLRFGNDI